MALRNLEEKDGLENEHGVRQTDVKPLPEAAPQAPGGEVSSPDIPAAETREGILQRLRLLWHHRVFLRQATITGLLLGALIAFVLPTRYDSTTQLMPPDNQSSSGLAMMAALTARMGNGIGGFSGDLLGIKSSGALFIGVLRSRTVEDRLVERFQLQNVYWWVPLEVDARQKLAENTSISEDRKSGVITITVTDGDPKRAAALAQAYVEELDRLVAQLSTSSARREREFLEQRLKAVKLDLDQASIEFSQFASKNIAIDIKEQGKAMVEGAATLQGQLIATESELQGLKAIYTANNVRVRAAQARMEELKRQLEKVEGKANADTSDSAASGDSPYPSIRKLPILGVKFADLYRHTRIQEVVYETLTQQYEMAKVQEVKETPSVKVLDAASVPERKSFPPRLLIIILCAGLTLCGSVIWILGRARWEETAAGDPAKVFAMEIMQTASASMPWATPNGSRFHTVTHRVWNKIVRSGDSTSEGK